MLCCPCRAALPAFGSGDMTAAFSPIFFVILSLLPSAFALHCAFIHGAGHDSPLHDFVVKDSYKEYWGGVKDFVDGCDTVAFMFANTVEQGWPNPQLQLLACKTALQQGPYLRSPNSDVPEQPPVIRDTIVFTHSMGNQIFAASLKAGLCVLDDSSWWGAVSGPWKGALAADSLMAFCNQTKKFSKEVKELADILHYCVGQNLSTANYGLQTTYPGLPALLEVARNKINAALCGTSPNGLPTFYSPLLATASALLSIPAPHDGMVTFESCSAPAPPDVQWDTEPTSIFYRGVLNHADTTCRNGNSKKTAAKQPCSWYNTVVASFKDAMCKQRRGTYNNCSLGEAR